MQPVVQPVVQRVASCIRGLTQPWKTAASKLFALATRPRPQCFDFCSRTVKSELIVQMSTDKRTDRRLLLIKGAGTENNVGATRVIIITAFV